MVDFINGRYLARSFLDVLTSGLFGKAFSDCVEENIVQTPPSIIAFKTSVTHFKLQEYIKFFFSFFLEMSGVRQANGRQPKFTAFLVSSCEYIGGSCSSKERVCCRWTYSLKLLRTASTPAGYPAGRHVFWYGL